MKEHVAEIKKIFYITRQEPFSYEYENTILLLHDKNLITEGELKTKEALQKMVL